jgi:hypothetical protein
MLIEETHICRTIMKKAFILVIVGAVMVPGAMPRKELILSMSTHC